MPIPFPTSPMLLVVAVVILRSLAHAHQYDGHQDTSWDPECIQEPVGFGRGTVGGEGGVVVTPRNIKQLKNFLKDDVPRVILLDRTFDFTGTEGVTEGKGCYFKRCGEGFQYALDKSDTCDAREKTTVSYDVAGTKPLNVRSHKTLQGVNGQGVIRGKGLKLVDASNVIIRDISIVDINPQVIWGGDAITFNRVDGVWIHNVTIKNIGRQFLVSYQTNNTGITVSSCTFDGHTPHSPFCDGAAYWVWLFWGTDDRITLVNNRVLHTSGRLPHAGGYLGAQSFVHLVGNVFVTNTDVALEPWDGSYILAEGNQFTGMTRLVNERATNGFLYLADDEERSSSRCTASFGEPCLPNSYSDTAKVCRADQEVLAEGVLLGDNSVRAINDARRAAGQCALQSKLDQ